MGRCAKNSGLKRSLGAFELTMLGVGVIIGSGLFVITGVAAARPRRSRTDPFLYPGRSGMCLCSALLCRTGLSHSSIRKFLYICLCRAWRNFRLVYRLVYRLGIRSRHVSYCGRLVRLRREYSGTHGDPFTGEADHRLFQRRYHESAGHHHYFDHGNAAALGNERKCEAEQYPGICKN